MERLCALSLIALLLNPAIVLGQFQVGQRAFRGLVPSNIVRHGSCVAATTSCTLSAVSTGDLKVMFAVVNGSTTAPSLPASFTNIATGSVGSSSNSMSYRIYCSVASSGSDTGTGTATSATQIVAVSYTGAKTTTTANCATSGDATGGRIGTTNTATTQTYGPITMVNTSGKSFVAGFSGDHTVINCAPAGMTGFQSNGTGPAILAADTVHGVAAWGSTTCSVTSSRSVTYTIEILST